MSRFTHPRIKYSIQYPALPPTSSSAVQVQWLLLEEPDSRGGDSVSFVLHVKQSGDSSDVPNDDAPRVTILVQDLSGFLKTG